MSNIENAVAQIRKLVGDRVTTAMAVREHHGADASWHPPKPPEAVVYAHSTEEVSAIVKICAATGTPIIPFGVGSSMEGHIGALKGGVCIDLSEMNQILEVNAEDLDVKVQPGVTRKALNTHLRDTGLFFPIDPGADASIGGMTATRASGTNAVRYGTMRENVLALTVVLPDGQIIKTGGRARKSSAGYDLTRLFVGSEGTLGIFTEITLRLYGIPEATSSAICNFDSIKGAVDTVITTIQSGIPISRIELMDEVQMDALNRYSKLDYPVAPTLLLEFNGTEAGVKEQSEMVQAIAVDNGGRDFQWATAAEERNRLWQARHDSLWAIKALQPGRQAFPTDVCVPISKLADCIMETKKDLETTWLKAPILGHVGDGNFHMVLLIDRDDPKDLIEVDRINDRLVKRAIAMGGTCTGEHGIGAFKSKFLREEHGDAVDLMKLLKRSIDPQNLMNPGKMLPA
ncbi:MAG TPA: FAD-linked oxidase C-terminal domain-containing protein [Alphaproteobacteria bacterium]|jgi:D-lactate dehydrogenase (cytochrome)|nr:FAD-linked oxidase C-terminal domain-containing protein [Alphaproteobacteria bacterium]